MGLSSTTRTLPVLSAAWFRDGEDCSVRLERVLVEQHEEVGAASVRNELIRDMVSLVAGFLKDDSMKSAASRRKDVCGILACRARIPLGLTLRKTRHQEYRERGFGKGFMTRTGSVADGGLCSRRGGTGNPRVHASGGRHNVLSHWGGAGIRLSRGKGRGPILHSRQDGTGIVHLRRARGAWLSRR